MTQPANHMPSLPGFLDAGADRRRTISGAARAAFTSWGGALALAGVALSLMGLWPIGLALIGAGVVKTARDVVQNHHKQGEANRAESFAVPQPQAPSPEPAAEPASSPSTSSSPGLHFRQVLARPVAPGPGQGGRTPAARSPAPGR